MQTYKRACYVLFTFIMLGWFTVQVRAQNSPAFQPGNIIVSLGAVIGGDLPPPNPDQVREFTTSGALVQSIPITPAPGAESVPRDAVVGANGALYVYNGTFAPILSIYGPTGSTWSKLTCNNWAGVADVTYGCVAVNDTYAFVTSIDNIPESINNAVIRIKLADGTATRVTDGIGYVSLTLGWDGLLYAIEYTGAGSSTPIDVFDPITMKLIRSFTLPGDPAFNDEFRSIAVDKNGTMFLTGLDPTVYEYSANLTFLNKATIGSTKNAINLALSSDGQIAVADYDGFVYLTDETLSSFSSFQAYTANDQIAWQLFVSFVPYQKVTSISMTANPVVGGNTPTATVSLSGNAPAGRAPLAITSSNPAVVPNVSNVSVAAGASSVSFPVPTKYVSTNTTVTLTAAYHGSTTTTTITVNPVTISSIKVSPNPITGGLAATGTVTLTGPAPTGGQAISWTSSNTAVIPNGSAAVPAGQITGSFAIPTIAVTGTQSVKLTTSLNGSSTVATVSVVQSAIASFTATPTPVTGGLKVTGTVHLTAAAPSGGAIVKLTGNLASVIPIQSSVTVAAGQTQASFTMTTLAVTSVHSLSLTAELNGVYGSTVVVVVPAAIGSLSTSPPSIIGGNSASLTVNLTAPAPPGGTVVPLTSSNRAAVPTPATVTVPAGKGTASFPIPTNAVATSQKVTITATLYGVATTTLTVNPPGVSSFSLSTNTAQGGTIITGTVTLSGPAPIGGIVVELSSNNRAAVPIAASVTVLADKSTVSFTIPTGKVKADANVVLTATLNGDETARVTITP